MRVEKATVSSVYLMIRLCGFLQALFGKALLVDKLNVQ